MKFIKSALTVKGIDPRDRQRRHLLNIVIIFSVVLTVIVDIVAGVLTVFLKSWLAQREGIPIIFIVSAFVLPPFLGIFFLNRYVKSPVPGLIFLMVLLVVLFLADLPEQVMGGRGLLMFSVPIILASFLIVPYASFIAAGAVIAALCCMSVLMHRFPEIISMSIYFLLAFVSWIGSRSLNITFANLLETNTRLANELERIKEKDSALIENRIRAQAIFENTLNSVFLINDGENIVDVNPATYKLTGYDRSELTDSNIWSFIDDLSEKTKRYFIKRLRVAGKLKGTVKLRHKSGRIVHADFIAVMNILPGIHLAVFWDISERIESDRALRDSRELLRKTLESFKAVIFVIEAKTETVIDMNNAATEVFGYSRDELMGKTTEILHINPASFETFRANCLAALERKGYMNDFQYKMKRKDGAIFPTEHTMSPLVNDSGEITGWVCVIRDITERKRFEEQIFHSQKMEALGRLAGGITHDFNNLLTTIFGYCEIGKMGGGTDDGTRECFSEIKKAAERAATLTGQLLAFSRKQILTPKTIDLNHLILNMKKLLGRLIVENITIEYMLAERTDPIKADPIQIEQIIVNLVVNACDAMKDGGVVTIETKNCYFDEGYADQHPEIEPGHYTMIGISDTGSGMDEKTLKQIFDPFFTTKGYGKGTGLSLAIVFGIVKQSGGYIHVASELGHWTTFTLYFPRVEEDDHAYATVVSKNGISLYGNERILLIEDDEALRRIIVKTLVKYGYDVEEARTGNDALSLVMQGGKKKLDLVITDVIMPGMSGKDVADRLLAEFPGLKVLFISGYTDNVLVNHGISNNEKAFLQKPFSPDDIARKVREVFDAGKGI